MKKYKRNAKKRIFYNKKCYNCGNVDRFTIKEMRGLHFCQRCYKQHDTMSDVFANSVLELEKQNKRYREALSIISANLPLDGKEDYVYIARQALEDENEED